MSLQSINGLKCILNTLMCLHICIFNFNCYYIMHFQVSKLDRDPASGTALQEITFWLNLERALLRIQDKRNSLEIVLTLDILKHGKRFHATVSFDSDTGIFQTVFLLCSL